MGRGDLGMTDDGLAEIPADSDSLGRVLFVSADVAWTAAVSDMLEQDGYETVDCRLGARAVECLSETSPDMVVLDLALPDRYGITVCSLLRGRSSVPILAVGDRGDEQLVRALSAGADVFVPKKTSHRELLARVRALFRRARSTTRSADGDVVRIGLLELDRAARVVRFTGRTIAMTRREYELLEVLMTRPGRVVSRTDLLDSMWGPRRDPHALNIHVRRLRAKLEAFDPVRRIQTVRGVGFRFVVDEAGAEDVPGIEEVDLDASDLDAAAELDAAVVLDLRDEAIGAVDGDEAAADLDATVLLDLRDEPVGGIDSDEPDADSAVSV
jgi:two-component system phosphate regulon response regulator PhoB